MLGAPSGPKGEANAIKARIGEAAPYIDLDQLCLGRQCGFYYTVHRDLLGKWHELARRAEVAREVWGKAIAQGMLLVEVQNIDLVAL